MSRLKIHFSQPLTYGNKDLSQVIMVQRGGFMEAKKQLYFMN